MQEQNPQQHPSEEFPDYSDPETHPETTPPNEPAWAGSLILLGVVAILVAGFIFIAMFGWLPLEP
jgi:hypothetical protein